MNIVCAQCGAAVASELSSLANQTVVVCPTCRSGLRVTIEAFAVPAAVPAPPSALSAGDRDRVVVAIQGEATRELIGELLSGQGFEVLEAASGAEALTKVKETRPAFVLVDVGMSDVMGFQVVDAVRKEPANAGVKIILVAAIHNKDRYRRQPDNLFGADDYIERHQIETELIAKINALRAQSTPAKPVEAATPSATVDHNATRNDAQPAARSAAPGTGASLAAAVPNVQPAERPAPRPQPQAPTPPVAAVPPAVSRPPQQPLVVKEAAPTPAAAPEPSAETPAQQAAFRLARIIVSDIALYNAKKVDDGVLNGTFFELLRTEIEEGRKLYEERKGTDLPATTDLFQQTLEQFVATRRELLKRNRPAA
ncbi:MAG TPA: response regulator [Nitrospiria bacterium]|nr:response regulator [Nitrospiria bacterium]